MDTTSNNALEKQIQEKHEGHDCEKCKVFFKTHDDLYKHANNCSEIIEPLMCNKCNLELISKAGLKKHIGTCKGIEGQGIEPVNVIKQQDECRNGPSCWYLKHNRCNYQHSDPSELPWKKVQHRRKGCQQGSQQQEVLQHQNRRQHGRQQQPGKQSKQQQQFIECKNGPRCHFLKENRCLFLHKTIRQ